MENDIIYNSYNMNIVLVFFSYFLFQKAHMSMDPPQPVR
jgi:hypothetical protein